MNSADVWVYEYMCVGEKYWLFDKCLELIFYNKLT